MNCDDSLINDFVTEAKEHLATIEEDFLEMEKAGANAPKELIDKVFRAIHSIKGGAGFMGFRKMNDLSHVMESLLQKIRAGEVLPESRYCDELLVGVDKLNEMLADVNELEEVDIEDCHQNLSSMLEELGTNLSPSSTGDEAGQPEQNTQTKDDMTSLIMSIEFDKSQSKPGHLYLLRYDFDEIEENGGPNSQKILSSLLSVGKIMGTSLNVPLSELKVFFQKTPPQKCDMLFGTVLEPSLILEGVSLPSDNVTELSPAQIRKLYGEEEQIEIADEPAKASQTTEKKSMQKLSASQKKEKSAREGTDTIRIHVGLLDSLMRLAGELVLVRNQQLMSVDNKIPVASSTVQRLDLVTSELQETIMRTRMQPVGGVFAKLPRIVRDLSKKLGKKIQIETVGNEVELDKTILENLADPLVHIIRNSCDHGIEMPDERKAKDKHPEGFIRVRAFHEGGQINIVISDDGKGIDPEKIKTKALEKKLKSVEEIESLSQQELVNLVMAPGFSTAEKISDVSGRGVGMDVVRSSIEKLGGTFELSSKVNKGTSVHMRLPLTLAIIPSLIISVLGRRYAIPQVGLEELICLYDDDVRNKVERAGEQEVFRLRGRILPLVRLNEVLLNANKFNHNLRSEIAEKYRKQTEGKDLHGEILSIAVVRVGSEKYGLIVDEVQGTEEIVVQPMHPSVKQLDIYPGATVLGDGKVALILDVEGIARHAGLRSVKEETMSLEGESKHITDKQTVLLFRSGEKEQFAITLQLVKRIQQIKTEQIERAGNEEYITVDGESTYILRLDEVLDVSPYKEKNEKFLILPKHCKRPFGILISEIIDIQEVDFQLKESGYQREGLLGTSIIRDHMTLFIDIFRVIEMAKPEWYSEDRKFTKGGDGRRVLLAEDTPFFAKLITGYLEADGFEVVHAYDGKAALDKFEAEEFDLVISDLEMPVMDGWEFCRRLRSTSKGMEIPCIALTSLDNEEAEARAMEAGFDSFRVKIDREMLLETVGEMIHERVNA